MTAKPTLRQKVVRGIRWRGFADAVQMVLQISFTAVLARLLGLADFGLAAMCLLFLRFVSALTNVGFGTAVIQSQTITPGQISGIFVIQLGIKIGVLGVSMLTAPLAARFFDQPQLTEMIRVLAIVILLEGLSFPQILARKELRFRGYSLVELGSLVAANVLGIGFALAGLGVWSLIARYIAEKAIYAIAIWPVVGWRPARPSFRGVAPHLRFGFTLFASSTVYFLSQHLAAVIIGKFIGAEALGLYNVAYNLGIVPAQKVQNTFATVLMPAFAVVQTNTGRIRPIIRAAMFTVGAAFVPAMIGVAAIAPNFVHVVYGAKWSLAGDFLVFLAFVGLLKGLEHLLRSVLIAGAKVKSIFYITVVETLVSMPLLWVGSVTYGVWGIIVAYTFASVIAAVMTGLAMQRQIADRFVLIDAFGRTVLVAALMFAVVFPLPRLLSLDPGATLIIQIGIGVVLYASLRWLALSRTEWQIVSSWRLFRREGTLT